MKNTFVLLTILLLCVITYSNDGLIAYYPFNGNANDESGNQNHGEVIGATLTADRFGNGNSAYYFDGVDDYIDCGNSTILKPEFPISISTWVNIKSLNIPVGIFLNCTGNARYYGVLLFVHDSGKVTTNYGNAGTIGPYSRRSKQGDTVLFLNNWYHIVTIFKNTDEIEIFVNGQNDGGHYDGYASSMEYDTDGSGNIGRFVNSTTNVPNYANTILDDICLYNYSLSDAEIDSLYHRGGWWPVEEEPELLAYYPFNGNVNDESGNQNHGVVIGATPTADRFGNENSAYYFDGMDDYIEIEDTPQLRLNDTDYTIEFWVNPYTRNSSYHSSILSKRIKVVNYSGYIITITGSQHELGIGKPFFILSGGRDPLSVGDRVIPLNRWTHIAWVYSKDDMLIKTYIDGKIDTFEENFPQPNSEISEKLFIGADVDGYPYNFNGKIDDIGIWNNALNVEQIDSLYQIGDWQNRFQISSIIDVPEDQGAWVYVNWYASPLDTGRITQYGVWEENPEGEWVSLGNVPAIQEEHYTYLAHTFHDLSIDGIYWSKFKVTAHTIDPSIFYTSEIDSGYSIDNIIPNIPEGLIASITEGNTVELGWDQSFDEDFNFFRIYRSQEPDFDPADPYLIEEIVNNTCKDTKVEPGQTYYYKVSAIDIHGNESQLSEMVEIVIPQVGINESLDLPSEFSLFQNYPNPFNPSTTLRYDLPRESTVQLSIYNLNGYLIQTLINAKQNAGRYSVVWDASNQPSGVYLYKIQAGDFQEIRKCLLVK